LLKKCGKQKQEKPARLLLQKIMEMTSYGGIIRIR